MFDTGDFIRPTGYDNAKEHIFHIIGFCQQNGPKSLYHDIQGHPVLAGQLAQGTGRVNIQKHRNGF